MGPLGKYNHQKNDPGKGVKMVYAKYNFNFPTPSPYPDQMHPLKARQEK